MWKGALSGGDRKWPIVPPFSLQGNPFHPAIFTPLFSGRFSFRGIWWTFVTSVLSAENVERPQTGKATCRRQKVTWNILKPVIARVWPTARDKEDEICSPPRVFVILIRWLAMKTTYCACQLATVPYVLKCWPYFGTRVIADQTENFRHVLPYEQFIYCSVVCRVIFFIYIRLERKEEDVTEEKARGLGVYNVDRKEKRS
jgi:hypothetical protein